MATPYAGQSSITHRLRKAVITDLPMIYRGERDYIQRWEPSHEDGWLRQTERHLASWVEHFDRIVLATVDEQFAGYCLWMPEDGRALLCTIGVSAPYRCKGIGAALLKAYTDDARQAGFAHLTLSVREDNPAKRLYEKAGFTQTAVDANGYLRFEWVTSYRHAAD
ncbi:GNAT family N-acetyltransferase [Pseudomonas fluorescens]|nr:GNAT family N-acetyltransferase [Pseudomonas fluorescens]